MKKILIALLALLMCISVCACEEEENDESRTVIYNSVPEESEESSEVIDTRVKIPDIADLDEATAKTLILSLNLIPKIQYEYNDDTDYNLVVRTEPAIGEMIEPYEAVTIYICNGPVYKDLNGVARFWQINNIDSFSWGDDGNPKTKYFKEVYVAEGYLYISGGLKVSSKYAVSFYQDFGTATINDEFNKTVPIDVIYDSQTVDTTGTQWTEFTLKIPLGDLGVQKPTNITVEFDFVVNGVRETFKSSYDITWQ